MGAPNLNQSIDDFEVDELLGRGTTSSVYRVRYKEQIYAIKQSNRADLDGSILQSFRCEASILAQFDSPQIVQPYTVGVCNQLPYIVLEYVDHPTLEDLLSKQTLNEKSVTRFALLIARVLSRIHDRQLLHRDLKPKNIFWDPTTEFLKLIDFGLATRADFDDHSKTVGTVAYMSPEQTGVISKGVDARSDLYSLGIILYKMVTGTLPFRGENAAEVMSQHLNAKVPDPRALHPSLSTEIAEIIIKLMQKDPAERFQSARELALAIEPSSYEAHRSEHVPLVGRDRELAEILTAFSDAKEGRGQSVLVRGSSGIGKSRLVNEAILRMREHKPLVLSGKCDAHIPFGLIRSLFTELASYCKNQPDLARSDKVLQILKNNWKSFNLIEPAILDAYGIEKPSKTVVQIAQIEQHCIELFSALNEIVPTLVVYADDVQWLDPSSLRILAGLCQVLNDKKIFIIMTARDGQAYLESLQLLETRLESSIHKDLTINKLEQTETGELSKKILGKLDLDDSVIGKIFRQTNGNPFAIGEYIRNLVQLGCISPHWAHWQVDLEMLERIDLPENVVELVKRRLSNLSDLAKICIKSAALFGVEFQKSKLVDFLQTDPQDIDKCMLELVQQHYIESTGQNSWRFIHDRIRETALTLMSRSEQAASHQKIAEFLEVKLAENDETNDVVMVYAIANHFIEGTPRKNSKRASRACVRAARSAVLQKTYEKAYEYFGAAEEMRKQANLDCSSFLEEHADMAALAGHKEEAISRYRTVIGFAERRVDRVRVYSKMADALRENMENRAATVEIKKAFYEARVRYPSLKSNLMPALFWGAYGLFCLWTGFRYGSAKGEKSERYKLVANLYQRTGLIQFFDTNAVTGMLSGLRGMRMAQLTGDTDATVNSYCMLSVLFASLRVNFVATKLLDDAEEIALRLNDLHLIAHVQAYRAYVIVYAGKEAEGESKTLGVLQDYRQTLPSEDFVYLSGVAMSSLLLRGYGKECLQIAKSGIDLIEQRAGGVDNVRNEFYMMWFYGYAMAANVMLGNIREAQQLTILLEEYFKDHSKDDYHFGIYMNAVMQRHFEQGEFTAAIEKDIEEHRNLNVCGPLKPLHIRHFYVTQAHIRVYQFRRNQMDAQVRLACRRALRQLSFVSDGPLFWGQMHMCKAEYHRLLGDNKRCYRHLKKAEDYARITCDATVLYECYLTRARLANSSDQIRLREHYLKLAMHLCVDHSWFGRQQRLQNEFQELMVKHETSSSTMHSLQGTNSLRTIQGSSTSRSSAFDGEFFTEAFLKVSLAASKTLDPLKQAIITLDELIKLFGAERAALFLGDQQTNMPELYMARGTDQQTLGDFSNYSHTVVKNVWLDQKPVVTSGTEEGELIESESITAFDLRSVICSPVSVAGKQIGVVYLDNRFMRGVFNREQLNVLSSISTQMGVSIETARSTTMKIQSAEMEKDLELTGAVQQLLIPADLGFDHPECAVSSFYSPANRSGGDWLWHQADKEGITLIVGDVTGHGPGPAMITALVSGIFHANEHSNLSEFYSVIDRNLKTLTKSEFWMSMIAIRYEFGKSEVELLNAGSPPILIAGRTEKVQRKYLPSSPLGGDPYIIHQETLPIRSGERLLIYTDGAYEFQYRRKIWGIHRLQKALGSLAKEKCEDATRILSEKIYAEMEAEPEDDIAFILFEKK